jgi:hypothetical protein
VRSSSLLEHLAQAPAAWQPLVSPGLVTSGVSAAFAACLERGILQCVPPRLPAGVSQASCLMTSRICTCPWCRSAPRIIDNTVVLGVDLSGRIKAAFPALFETSAAPKPKKKISEPKVREVVITHPAALRRHCP